MRSPNRRNFLASAAGVVALSSFRGTTHAAEADSEFGPQFKYSLAAYSYRRLLQGDNPQLTLFDFVDDCARFGLHGTELTSYYFPKDADPDFLRKLKRHCFRRGLDVSGTAVGNDFGHPQGERREAQISSVKRWIDYAEILGAPVIRIFAGHAHGASEDDTHRLMVDGIRECCQYAGQHGVHLALENHGGPTSTAAGILRFVRDVESPWFGVNLDTGNFHGEDVYGELEEVAPHAINVQVKVTVSGADGRKRETDYQRLAQILRDAKYRGYVVLEYEEGGDPRAECKRYVDVLRDRFGSAPG